MLLASFAGTTIEWYDFFIFGTAASLVLGQLFFSAAGEVGGTLAALATFGVGFVARPVGAVVCGHYGDRLGRKKMLVATLLIMGVSTFLVGVLPTTDQIGVLAPVLLVVLRLAQGFAVGGEWGGAVLMAVEHSPEGRRGLYGSAPQMGVPAGLLMATGVFALVSTLPDEQFLSWGWRVPFLLSALLVIVGLVVRLKVAESPDFESIMKSGSQAKLPLLDAIKEHPKGILIAAGARVGETVQFYVGAVFIITYASLTTDLSRSTVLTGILIAAALELVTIPVFARLSDVFGRRPIYLFGTAGAFVFAYPFFLLVDSEQPVLVWLAAVLALAVFHSAMYAPQAAFFSELFPARVRYSGAAFGYQVTGAIVGGFTPLAAAALLAAYDNAAWPVATYIMVFAAITLVSVFVARETYRVRTSAQDATT
ncbi:MFS transporter [Modestobacter sp. DSM 44400]|uniref:MFS transporter n=1 Tax=Modestobacter sp. DSM 44400 TaxID=1550230 RepID=UPI001C311EC8|nr:MFS transporter [Modestobacter sp. DSM 44400]